MLVRQDPAVCPQYEGARIEVHVPGAGVHLPAEARDDAGDAGLGAGEGEIAAFGQAHSHRAQLLGFR
ncbi:hypothetical protein GCM10009680_56920 [Streptomyces yatensis]|uniref:Uncharacterized protein n=1 Tax=Streptomyces yatensis TaxID=155177 RepID=A0ABN2INL7_9ACTN